MNLRKEINQLVLDFHANKITVDELQDGLLSLNDADPQSLEYNWYFDWVIDNIEYYKAGSEYVLSLYSSGSILQTFED